MSSPIRTYFTSARSRQPGSGLGPGARQVGFEVSAWGCRGRQRSQHHIDAANLAGRRPIHHSVTDHVLASQVTQPALDPVAGNGVAHSLGDHEADPDTIGVRSCPGVQDQCRTSHANAATDRPTEVSRRVQPGGTRQHRGLRRTLSRKARSGPCDDGRPGWPDRRGSASADGNRGCGCDAAGSAGRCACSRESSKIARGCTGFVSTAEHQMRAPDSGRCRTATCQRYGDPPRRSNSQTPPADAP